ncbi:hypothetical protein DPMN_030953 [Dreissena polymorpha]|uniref:Uncharacterized protein n=1 Tax=Dreissena polymorpha TaxID=45954 RepID=A0A9D4M1C8_DREPO|nr:hypothetical protein DPMN_030953 [Dreissena polymorpha]
MVYLNFAFPCHGPLRNDNMKVHYSRWKRIMKLHSDRNLNQESILDCCAQGELRQCFVYNCTLWRCHKTSIQLIPSRFHKVYAHVMHNLLRMFNPMKCYRVKDLLLNVCNVEHIVWRHTLNLKDAGHSRR